MENLQHKNQVKGVVIIFFFIFCCLIFGIDSIAEESPSDTEKFDFEQSFRQPEKKDFKIHSFIDPNGNTFNTEISLNYHLDKHESGILMDLLLKGKYPYSFDATLEGTFQMIKNLETSDLDFKGKMDMDDGDFYHAGLKFADDVFADLEFNDNRVNLKSISGLFFHGVSKGNVIVKNISKKSPVFNGALKCNNIQLKKFTEFFFPESKLSQGTGNFHINFQGSLNPLDFKTNGKLLLNNADLWSSPFFRELLIVSGLGSDKGKFVFDVDINFESNNYEVHFKEFKIYNRFAALRAEPDSTLDLRTNEVRMYVNILLLSRFREKLEIVPFVADIFKLKDTLTRLEITGKFSEPKISKNPVKDVGKGTLEFFGDVLKSTFDLKDLPAKIAEPNSPDK